MTDRFEVHEHDVLIIGAGGAGLRAAIEAHGWEVRDVEDDYQLIPK